LAKMYRHMAYYRQAGAPACRCCPGGYRPLGHRREALRPTNLLAAGREVSWSGPLHASDAFFRPTPDAMKPQWRHMSSAVSRDQSSVGVFWFAISPSISRWSGLAREEAGPHVDIPGSTPVETTAYSGHPTTGLATAQGLDSPRWRARRGIRCRLARVSFANERRQLCSRRSTRHPTSACGGRNNRRGVGNSASGARRSG